MQQYGNGVAAGEDESPEFTIGRLHDDLRLYRRREFIGVVRFIQLHWKHTTRFFAIRLKTVRYRDRVLAVGRAKQRGIAWTATAIVEGPGVVRIGGES